MIFDITKFIVLSSISLKTNVFFGIEAARDELKCIESYESSVKAKFVTEKKKLACTLLK